MAEHDEEQDDDLPEQPQRIFTLTEAERTRQELEPFLVEAMGVRKKLSVLEQDLMAVSTRIMMMGGVLVPYAKLAEKRMEHQSLAEVMKTNLEKILSTGHQQRGSLSLLETRRGPYPLLPQARRGLRR
jgi:hypothetical protein